MSHIVIFAEQREGSFKKATYEVITAAKELNASKITALVCGDQLDFAKELSVDHVIALEDPLFKHPTPDGYTNAVVSELKNLNSDIVLFPHSAMGRDIAPRVAAELDVGCATDATHLSVDGTSMAVTRYANSGKTIKKVSLQSTPAIVSIRPNAYPPYDSGSSEAQFEKKSLGLTDDDIKVRVTEIVKGSDKLDLTEADTIVAGGRGLKAQENFNLVEELAGQLGAAIGASRAVVDAGWRPHGEQVGQTGKTVSPTLYIAIAISGAIQHLAGMSSSKVIVAINTDKDAPIFKVADYGIVGDAFEVVPKLIEALK